MNKDILSNYGPESKSGSRPMNGGQCEPKPLPYDPPKGPTSQMQQSPGLHGTNHGVKVNQGKH